MAWRWPDGFACPHCAATKYFVVGLRRLFQCARCLALFACRFNRRYELAAMFTRLTWVGLRTPPMPYRLLKLAEVYG